MAEVFLKGSAYSIPFLVKSGKTTITNENVASVRLGLGNLTASWPGGRLRYSGGYWLFPVTQAQSYALPQGETYYQAQIQMASGETFSSKRQCIFVDGTIFRTPFGETQLATPETADAQPIPAQIEPKPEQIAVEIQTLGGGLPSGYVLPPATSDKLGGIKADAKTENDTVPARIDADGKLWVKGPVFLVTATSSDGATGTADKTALEIKDAIDAGSSVVMKLTISGRDYYLSLAQDVSDIDAMAYAFSCIAVDDTGAAQMNLGAVVAMNGAVLIKRLIMPGPNSSDAGKILTVGVDGNYALTELPKYDGGVS